MSAADTPDNAKAREIRKLLSRAASARYESDLATAEARYHQALRRAGRRFLKGLAQAQREASR
jgi:hypothetical protein